MPCAYRATPALTIKAIEVSMSAFSPTRGGELFRLLEQPKFQTAAVIEAALRVAHAGDIRDQAVLDPILEEFVRKSMGELRAKYVELFAMFWSNEGTAADEFKDYVEAFFAMGHFPTTETSDRERSGPPLNIGPDHSGLWICGYRVGKTQGMEDGERHRFLDCFFRHPLPPVVEQYCGETYSTPDSEARLKKMANVIAANCRNFKRIDAHKYRQAILDYEVDLRYLKKRYYRSGYFPWPKI